jgi:soluble lytic murein transglycosylase-like protein
MFKRLIVGLAWLATCGVGAAALVAPADPPPDWTEDAPVLSRLLEQAYAAQVAGWLPEAADRYCQAARLGHLDAQYRLGRLLADSPDAVQRAQGHASLALAAQRGHAQAQVLLARLQDAAVAAGNVLPMGDPPQCQLTGEALALAMPTPAEPPPTEAVPHEVVERYVLALPADKRRNAQLIQYLAPRFSVDPRFALAIARAESNFDAEAVSPKNAQGLMQLIPDTAIRFGVRIIRVPEQNVRGGLAYLKWLLARFDGDVALASAAYNAGEKAVERHGGVPPYVETQDYVKRILRFYRATVHLPPVSRK